MRTPEKKEVEDAIRQINKLQSYDRPRGMHPEAGLLYQPIPFEEFQGLTHERNSSEDRLALLNSSINYDGKKVLDLGCANGFFLFSLIRSEKGISQGLGVDHFTGNVMIGNIISQLYGYDEQLDFTHGKLSTDFLQSLFEEGSWDVCHLLSVHHHLIRDLGIDETKKIFKTLHENVETVAIEQGMITDEEFENWTDNGNEFASGSFARMLEMMESCGVPKENCFPIGIGMYLSGDRDDNEGWKRVMVGFTSSENFQTIDEVIERNHSNGILMELIMTGKPGDGEVWKHAVSGGSHAERELRALRILKEEKGFPRIADSEFTEYECSKGLIRLQRLELRKIEIKDIEKTGKIIRKQAVDILMSMASNGIIHNEINTIHLLMSGSGNLVLIDFETSFFVWENRQEWMETVWAPNPSIGVGAYNRDVHQTSKWNTVDIESIDNIFREWKLPELSIKEKERYLTLLSKNR